MEENKEKNEKINTEDLKKETVETAKKVKESITGTNIKEETLATKGFISEMIKHPLKKVKEVSQDKKEKFLGTSLFLLILWTIIVFIDSSYVTIHYMGFSRVFSNLLNVLKKILSPITIVIAYSIIIYLMRKKNSKSMTNIFCTVLVTQVPLIVASVASLLTIFNSRLTVLTSPFTALCGVIAIILEYFGFKYLFGEEDDNVFIKKFVVIQAVYYVIYILLGIFGIYI